MAKLIPLYTNRFFPFYSYPKIKKQEGILPPRLYSTSPSCVAILSIFSTLISVGPSVPPAGTKPRYWWARRYSGLPIPPKGTGKILPRLEPYATSFFHLLPVQNPFPPKLLSTLSSNRYPSGVTVKVCRSTAIMEA